MVISDDFASGVLDSVWSIEGPSGISSGLGTNATDAYLELVTPDGDYDVWDTNNGARAMQVTDNTDFQIETRFLTTPTEKYQLQGLLVEQDADNWIRFDTYSNGKKLFAFAAITIDGVSTQAFRVTVSGGSAPYLRVDRTGDVWTMEYSVDGSTWVTAGSFSHALTVTETGVFAGNTGNATGFTAQVDYFENTADPLTDEDGTIVPVNQSPDAVDDGLTTDEDVALVINVAGDLLANDSDPEGDPISLTGVTQPANGTLTDNGDGTYTYTPNAGYSGADSFTYTISDGSSTDTATVNLTVNDTTPSNDPPDAVDDGLTTDEDVALVINVAGDLLANDSDPEGDPISLTGVTQPANGTLTDNGDGTYTYTPNTGFNGFDSFTYTISDGNSTDTATVNLTVNDTTPSNDPPDALNDGYLLDPGGSLTVSALDGVLRNDSDPDGDALTVSLETGPSNGVLTLGADGSFTYTADPGHLGGDSFSYRVTDPSGTSDVATVSLSAVNSTPVITTGSSRFTKTVVSTAMPLTHIALAADFDQDGDLDIVSTSEQDHSVVWFENDGAFNFTSHTIDAALDSAYPASLADLDQDGHIDVLVGGYREDVYAWYRNDGAGNFTKNVILNENGAHSVFAADFDGDGDLDLVTAGQEANTISWHENDGNENFTTYVIDAAAMAAKSSMPVDLDGDGDLDIVTASFDDDTVAWYENDGSQNFTKRLVDTAADGSYFTRAADIDGDGDLDLLNASKNDDTIAWYRNDGGIFTKILITANADAARYVDVADVDGDGDLDVTSASVDDNTIRLYLNDGSGNFTTVVADDNAVGAYGAVPADMNGDGLVDILGASKTDGTVSILFHEKFEAVELEPGNSLAIDAALLTATDAEQSAAQLIYTLDALPGLGEVRLDGVALGIGDSFTQEDVNLGRISYHQTGSVEGSDNIVLKLSDGIAPATTFSLDLTIATPPPPSGLVSDDFAAGALDPSWTIEGPAGISSGFATNASDAYLELITPDGDFDIWDTNNSARAMQVVADVDFQIETRFLSTPTERYQIQGLLVEEDANNWIRFDTYSNGSSFYAFAGITVDGDSSTAFKVTIPGGSAPYLRLTRAGDDWTLEYSTDGAGWVTAGSFTHALNVTKAGVFAGNTANASGFVGQVDYFENTAEPIADEDGSYTPVNLAPDAADDGLVTPVDAALLIDVNSDLLANDSDPNSDPFSLTGVTSPTNGTLIDNGNGTYTYTPDPGYSGNDSFTYTISDGELTDTATVTIAVGNPIDVWYGLTQSFGSPGEGQERINILGNVGGNVTALTYSLNGGPEQTLSVGADGIRLQNPGDFNIDIFYSALDGSAADDVVTITATLAGGAVVTRDVVVEYEDGAAWDPNYSIDWDTVTNAQDVLQIVDGTWSWDGNGIRPVDLGYDRLLVLGDQDWDNYEVNLTIDMHDLQNEHPVVGGGFTFGMLWNGHTDSRYGDIQPLSGWEPGAALYYTNERFKNHSYHEWSEVLGVTPKLDLQEGLTYNFTIRVEQTGIYDRIYSLKVWEEGTTEPVDWTLQSVETFSLDEAPATGSLYLNAHYFDVTFGDITVTEITGSDIIQGDDSAEVQVAVDTGSATPGLGEVDVFVGAGGADVFVFGDANGTYYDDGVGADAGEGDYGFVYDFISGTDQVQLAGVAADYVLSTDAPGLSPGTAIWRLGENGDADELVGLLNSVYGLDLNSDDFIFTDTLLV